MMKRSSTYFATTSLIVIALLILPAIAFANSDVNTDIEVSNNGANSQNNVSVSTNTGGNYINGQEVSPINSGHVHIKLNDKTYDYDNTANVSVQDDNGKTNVTVNGQPSSSTKNTQDDDISGKPDADDQISQVQKQIADAKAKADHEKQKAEKRVQDHQNAIQQLIQKIQDFFKHLKLF